MTDNQKDTKEKEPNIFARVLEKKSFYIGFFTVSALAVSGMIYGGWSLYQKALAVPVQESPYMDLAAKDSPAKDWASKFISEAPQGISDWTVSEDVKPKHIIDVNLCSKISSESIPISLYGTYSANGSGVSASVQIYGAGQAIKEFNSYVNILKGCIQVSSEEHGEHKLKTARYDGGFLITAGDSILSVTSIDESKLDSLLEEYSQRLSSSLTESKCLNLNVSIEDSKRSFFYDRSSYVGFLNEQTLTSELNTKETPTPSSVDILSIKDTNIKAPEGPLPENFPSLPSESVEKPTLPSAVHDQDTFSSVARYQVADTDGPGCGWSWSSQVSPEYDTQKLQTDKENSISSAQKSADDLANQYVTNKLNWAFSVLNLLPQIDKWNSYANSVNTVHDKWTWLNNERSKIQTSWYTYVRLHDAWVTFDADKTKALEDYNNAISACKNPSNTEQSPSPSPSHSPSPSPSPSPSQNASPSPNASINCDTPPERPAILDQTRGEEPKAPTIPDGVTIPDSWPKLKTS